MDFIAVRPTFKSLFINFLTKERVLIPPAPARQSFTLLGQSSVTINTHLFVQSPLRVIHYDSQ